jgi:hypothetical protein
MEDGSKEARWKTPCGGKKKPNCRLVNFVVMVVDVRFGGSMVCEVDVFQVWS